MATVENNALFSYPYAMKRLLSQQLSHWAEDPRRRALILRGARQVGKTWIIRELAREQGLDLLELNFERDPGLARTFDTPDPRRILGDLELLLEHAIQNDRSLLFLDEIQDAPELLQKLRWFTEEIPELRVVAAGSLLEFAIRQPDVSIPVGRVTYLHMDAMSFEEYLMAHGQAMLLQRLAQWTPGESINEVVHQKASEWYERYMMVGGMPGVVVSDVEQGHPGSCRRMQTDLVAAFREDFAKYAARTDPSLIDRTLQAVTAQLGSKFVYAKVNDGITDTQAKRSLELLQQARLVCLAYHSQANGIPLGGEIKARNKKAFLLDIGLVHAMQRTPAGAVFPKMGDLSPSIRGKLSEQMANQQLRSMNPARGDEPLLYYWQQSGGRHGEIDLLVEIDQHIVPVELKAGSAGSMKSLHQFMHDKKLAFAVRVDTNPPSLQNLDLKTTQGDRAAYTLLAIPGYLLWRLPQLCSPLL